MIIPFSQWVYFDYQSKNRLNYILRRVVNTLLGFLALLKNSSLIARNLRFFKKFDPDLIVSNSAAIGHGIAIAAILRREHLWHLREFLDKDYSLKFYFGKWVSHAIIRKSHFIDKNTMLGMDCQLNIFGYREI